MAHTPSEENWIPGWGDDLDTDRLADAFRDYADALERDDRRAALTGIEQKRTVKLDDFDIVEVTFRFAPDREGCRFNFTPKRDPDDD